MGAMESIDLLEDSGARPERCDVMATSVDITPGRALPLAGYHLRRGASSSVRGPLEANILGFFRGSDKPFYLVSVDTLYGGALGSGLIARLGIAPEQLTVMGSHTHFAPAVDPELAELGKSDVGYIDFVVERIATAIQTSRRPRPGEVSFASLSARNLMMNRRRPRLARRIRLPRLGRVLAAPHPQGPVDDALRLARVTADGELLAVLWGASCHPVCSPNPQAVSPCYPGIVRAALRASLGEDIPVLFSQGFSADVRPNSRSRVPPLGARKLVTYLMAGCTRFIDQGETTYQRWCHELAAIAAEAELKARSERSWPTTKHVVRHVQLTPAGWTRALVMSRIHMSEQVSLVTVNAEIPSERAAELQGEPSELTIPSGCCDEVIGYWPTDRMLREGGYEGGDSARFFPALDWEVVGGPDALWKTMIRRVMLTGEGSSAKRRADSLPGPRSGMTPEVDHAWRGAKNDPA